jgi:hypothetical protein
MMGGDVDLFVPIRIKLHSALLQPDRAKPFCGIEGRAGQVGLHGDPQFGLGCGAIMRARSGFKK